MRISTPSWTASSFRVRQGTHVEADDDRAGSLGQHHVGVGDTADSGVQDVEGDLAGRELRDLVLERLERPGHVGLDHEVQLHGLTRFLGPLEHVLEADRNAHAARQRLGLQPDRPLVGEMARLAVVRHRAHRLARVGQAVEAEHLDRLAWSRLLEAVSEEVVHRAHAAPVRAGHERVAGPQGPAQDHDGHGRSAARVEP